MIEQPARYACKHWCEREKLKDIILTQSCRAAEAATHYSKTLETQAAENERLKNILRDCDPESMSWLDARDAALGETE
jgi:hypothetical protein